MNHTLFYTVPARDWNHALPLGNGSMGAMCFGGTVMDRWSLNDDTVWSGGYTDRNNPDARAGIQTVRRLLREGRVAEAEELAEETVIGTPEGERSYEPLCELAIQFKTETNRRFHSPIQVMWFEGMDMRHYEPSSGLADYRRVLDLSTGVHTVSYTLDGIPFTRTSFISYPAGVMVIRMEGGAWSAL